MLLNKYGFRVFNEYDLGATLDAQFEQVKREIEQNLKSQTSGDKSEYISKQVEKYKIAPLEFSGAGLTVTTAEAMIPAEYFPQDFVVHEGKSYPKEVFTFHLPFSGDKTLLKCVPSTRLLWTEEVAIENDEIIFDVINFSNSVDEIKRKRDEVVSFLQKQALNVNAQVNKYNETLSSSINDIITATENKLTQKSEILSQLGTPLKVQSTPMVNNEQEQNDAVSSHVTKKLSKHFDVFICHASEDKEFVKTLAEAIKNSGIDVWYDDFQLGWGDDLRPSIDNGLKNSKYGIVVFSKSFLAKKNWTEYELNGLLATERVGKKVILPVWHDITRDEMAHYSPTLSDRIALKSNSIDQIVLELTKLVK